MKAKHKLMPSPLSLAFYFISKFNYCPLLDSMSSEEDPNGPY